MRGADHVAPRARAGLIDIAVSPVLIATGILLVGCAMVIVLLSLSRPGVGGDWAWYADGLARLVGPPPLYDPSVLAGHYEQFDVAHTNVFTLIPPAFVTLIVPMLAVPASLQFGVWWLAMTASVIAAFALVWPRLTAGGSVALVGVIAFAFAAVPSQLFWANLNALIALGVALMWVGHRRGSHVLIGVGLALVAFKVTPALTLGLWVVATGRWRAIPVALGIFALLTIPPIILEGPHVLADFVASGVNIGQAIGSTNIAPSLLLRPLLGERPAIAVMAVVGLVATLLAVRRDPGGAGSLFVAVLAAGFLAPNVWAHWLVAPMVAAVAWLGISSSLTQAALQSQPVISARNRGIEVVPLTTATTDI